MNVWMAAAQQGDAEKAKGWSTGVLGLLAVSVAAVQLTIKARIEDYQGRAAAFLTISIVGSLIAAFRALTSDQLGTPFAAGLAMFVSGTVGAIEALISLYSDDD